MMEREAYYQSHNKLGFIGTDAQAKLDAGKVLVIGAGGLGCPCLLSLTGCGIGTIGVADFDTISVSNLHRQTLYGFDHVGYSKTRVAKEVLERHNPYISIVEHHLLVDETNVLDLIEQYGVVVDGTDNFAVRYLINDACIYLNKPLVYGAIYQAEGHVTVFNYHNSATLRCLFPEPDAETYVPSCAEVGAYNVVTTVIGSMMANEAVKVILQNKKVLANKLVTYDALSVEMRTIGYKQKAESRETSLQRFNKPEASVHISPEEFNSLPAGTYQLIDVREEWERDEHHIGGVHIPLIALNHHDFSALLKSDPLIIYCQQGQRSEVAAKLLRKMGFEKTVSLRGGLAALGEGFVHGS